MIPVGTPAPNFILATQRGNKFTLSDYRGKNVLLLFLPAAFTPICTTELPALSALYPRFYTEANTIPVAITVDNTNANLAWARQCNGNGISVLSDFYPHGSVSQAYGAWIPAEGISARATVIIDKNGIVRYSLDAGKFGKRSIPGLLRIASEINGGKSVVSAGANAGAILPALDLPILFSSKLCSHCTTVKDFLAASGLSQRIVVRDVIEDPAAMNQLLQVLPEGGVPTLYMNGKIVEGDEPIINALKNAYGIL